MRKLKFIAVLFTAIAAILSSCSQDKGEENLELSKYTLYFDVSGNEYQQIAVLSDTQWAVENGAPSWIQFTQADNSTLLVNVTDTEDSDSRNGELTVRAGKTIKTIKVNQAGHDTRILLEVSSDKCFFEPQPKYTVQLTIDSGAQDWEIISCPDWITLDPKGNGIIVTASENNSRTGRTDKILVGALYAQAEIEVVQYGTQSRVETLNIGNIPVKSVSRNGRYATGVYNRNSFILDMATGAIDILEEGTMAYDISDDGIAVAMDNSYPSTYNFHTKEIQKLDLSFMGFTPDMNPATHCAMCISADGKIIASGVSKDLPGYPWTNHAAIWREGKGEYLHSPLEDLCGDTSQGYQVNKFTSDGSILLGRQYQDMGNNVLCYWDMAEKDKIHHWGVDNEDFFVIEYFPSVGMSYTEKYSRSGDISHNGRYLAGDVIDARTVTTRPFVYDLRTGDYRIMDEEGLTFVVDNEGRLFYGSPKSGVARTAYVCETQGSILPFEIWVYNNYQLEIPDYLSPMAITPDGSKIVCYTSDGGPWDIYILTLY